MFLSYLTLLTALVISGVAIYYSVAGLAAIFAAAVIPIIIMGGALEIAKLVTAVWLHRYWDRAVWWLKTYLTAAVLVLMFITSMGIFGFLSNAHVQQTAQGDTATAQLERINSEIARQEAAISRAEEKIQSAQTQGVGGDSTIQSQIDREQERIDRAYERSEPAIQEQRVIIERQEERIIDEIKEIESDLESLDSSISEGNISLVQNIIGVQSDGIMGPNTREAIQDYRDRKSNDKDKLETRLGQVADNPRVQEAREEIENIRQRVEENVQQSNDLINRLQSQLGVSTGEEIETVLDEQNSRIETASEKIDALTEEKYAIEAQTRELEAEVGPIKYIAEFVYGEDANKNLLEEAVRWVIVIIIFVFDPLAVLLLIASQYTFRWNGQDLFDQSTTSSPSTGPLPDSSYDADSEDNDVNHNYENNEYTQTNRRPSDEISNFALGNMDGELDQSAIANGPPSDYVLDYEDIYDEMYGRGTLASQNDLDSSVSKKEDEPEEFYTIGKTNDLEITENIEVPDEEQPHELSTGYVEYKGKRYTKDVFQRLYPKIQLQLDNETRETNAGFGTRFPNSPQKGDLFLRVDYLPTRLFKWNDQKWILVDKEQTDQYAYHEAYIDHLIEKISTGEYDPELLTDLERSQLKERLKEN